MGPLVQAADSLLSVLLLVFLITFFWFLWDSRRFNRRGLLARPPMATTIRKTTTAKAAGEALPRIAAEPFYQWFIWIGVLVPQLV